MNTVVQLPTVADRARLISAKQMAALCDVSLPHFRRLYRTGRVPAPIKIGERKLAWQLGSAMDFLAAKHKDAA